MTPHLEVLIKRVAELSQDGLEACHCTEEFTLLWNCLLSHQEKVAFECPRLADPSRNPAASKALNFLI
jgi:hypothetical protein